VDRNRRALTAIVSYSHSDLSHREKLEKTLSSLKRQKLLEIWTDQKIKPGEHIDARIKESLETVDFIILLISPDFVASDYCYSVELSTAIARHEAKQAIVVPVIVRPTDWETLPFGRLKALPRDGKAITTWENEDSAWLDIAKAIRELVADQSKRRNAKTDGSLRNARDYLKEEFSRLHQRYESGPSLPSGVISTGLVSLDDCLDGLHIGDLIVVASRPGLGHHDLILDFALSALLKHKLPVLYLSPRDAGSRVMRRATSAVGWVSSGSILKGDILEEEWPRITAAITLLSDSKFLIEEFANLDSRKMLERIKAICELAEIKMIVIEGVDYYVGLSSSAKGEKEAAFVSRVLRGMAKELRIPILLSLGLGPKLELRYDKRPLMSDLGMWHCLEQEADQLLFVYQAQFYEFGVLQAGMAEIIVAKNSHGSVGTVDVMASPQYCRFSDLEPKK